MKLLYSPAKTILFHQADYTKNLLKNYAMEACNGSDTILDPALRSTLK